MPMGGIRSISFHDELDRRATAILAMSPQPSWIRVDPHGHELTFVGGFFECSHIVTAGSVHSLTLLYTCDNRRKPFLLLAGIVNRWITSHKQIKRTQ
jgi:hypothetical protein